MRKYFLTSYNNVEETPSHVKMIKYQNDKIEIVKVLGIRSISIGNVYFVRLGSEGHCLPFLTTVSFSSKFRVLNGLVFSFIMMLFSSAIH
jgi:hypothetical protein